MLKELAAPRRRPVTISLISMCRLITSVAHERATIDTSTQFTQSTEWDVASRQGINTLPPQAVSRHTTQCHICNSNNKLSKWRGLALEAPEGPQRHAGCVPAAWCIPQPMACTGCCAQHRCRVLAPTKVDTGHASTSIAEHCGWRAARTWAAHAVCPQLRSSLCTQPTNCRQREKTNMQLISDVIMLCTLSTHIAAHDLQTPNPLFCSTQPVPPSSPAPSAATPMLLPPGP